MMQLPAILKMDQSGDSHEQVVLARMKSLSIMQFWIMTIPG
jgi:hypothetical protein